MVSNILQEAGGHKWKWFWSGNWPVFDQQGFFSERQFTDWRNATGKTIHPFVFFNEQETVTHYEIASEGDKLRKHLFDLFEENPRFILDSLALYDAYYDETISRFQEILSFDFSAATNEQLISVLRALRKLLDYNCFIDRYDSNIEKTFVPVLEQAVREKLPSLTNKEIVEKVSLLIRPQQISPATRERESFWRLVDLVKEDDELLLFVREHELFSDVPEEFSSFVSLHVQEHGYLRVVVNVPPRTEQEVYTEVREYILENKPYVIEEHRMGDRYDPGVVAQAQELEASLDFDERTQLLVLGIRKAVWLRVMDNALQGRTSTMMLPFLGELQKRLDVTKNELKLLFDSDIFSCLEQNNSVSSELLSKRKQLTAVLYLNERVHVFVGEEAKQLRNVIEATKEDRKDVLQGKSVVLGVYKGMARVARSIRDAEALAEGEVLICSSTSAYFVPSLQRAQAVVTEIVSLTNHAIIVAREKGIPCVAGIRNVLDQIKTGDVVEVDGNVGVVRILDRK